MKAQQVLDKLRGWNQPAKIVLESDLPSLMCQEGGGCDCRGCDKD